MKSNKLYLSLECLLIFGATPLVIAYLRPRAWMYLILWGAAFLAWRWLSKYNYSFAVDWNKKALNKMVVRSLVSRFLFITLVLALFTIVAIPDYLFSLPLQRPILWGAVIVFYPLLSVIPQEVLFRSFFFKRYVALFASPKTMIFFSALAFGWVHILLLNWVAVIFSVVGGLIFARTYSQTRSLAAVCLEHALYGCMIFTLGLGYYFYHGQAVH